MGWLELGLIKHLNKEQYICREVTRQRKNLAIKEEGYIDQVSCAESSGATSAGKSLELSLVLGIVLPFQVESRARGRGFLVSASSQLPLAQSDHYVKLEWLGVAYLISCSIITDFMDFFFSQAIINIL